MRVLCGMSDPASRSREIQTSTAKEPSIASLANRSGRSGRSPPPSPPLIWALIRGRFCGAKSTSGCRAQGGWGGSAHYPDPTAQSAPACVARACGPPHPPHALVQRVQSLNTAACIACQGFSTHWPFRRGFPRSGRPGAVGGAVRVRRRRGSFDKEVRLKPECPRLSRGRGQYFLAVREICQVKAEHDRGPTPGIRLS